MYPVMINLENKKVVVVGGGRVAARKIKTLVKSSAKVVVISPSLHEKIDEDTITWVKRCYQKDDLTDAKLVFACTDKPDVNRQVMNDAHPSQLVNNTGDKHFSDFYNVAIAQAKDFSVMISTNGISPERSKEIRRKLEKVLEEL